MSVQLALSVAAVLVPIVLLLSFAGCASFTTDESPPVTRPGPPLVVEPAQPPTGPPPATPPDAPDKYHSLVVGGGTELIAYWQLGEVAAVSAAEDSHPGVKYQGTYIGQHAIGDGVLRLGPDADDTAAAFDGATSHVEVPYQTLLNPASNTNFSVEAWIAPAAATAAGRHVVVGSYRLTAAGVLERGFVLELVGGAAPLLRGRVAPNGLVETALPPPVAGWYHVVMTYQAAATTLRLYVNIATSLQPRATDATANFTANRKTTPADTAPPLRIGAGQVEPPTATTSPSQFFAGRIDNVALYRGLVTASQIRAHFDAAQTS